MKGCKRALCFSVQYLRWYVTTEIQYTIFKCPTFDFSIFSRSLRIFHISTQYAENVHHLAHALEIK